MVVEWLEKIVCLSIVGSLGVICYGCCLPWLRNHSSARWSYGLLVFVMISFIFPIGMGIGYPEGYIQRDIYYDFTSMASGYEPIESSEEAILEEGVLAPSPINNQNNQGSRGIYVVFFTWILGFLIYIGKEVRQYLRLSQGLETHSSLVRDDEVVSIYESCRRELGIRRRIPVYEAEEITTPILTGIIQPKITVPKVQYTNEQWAMIFRHELTHYQGKDLWVKGMAMVIVGIHWFNPLTRILMRWIDEQCELRCDEKVLCRLHKESYSIYGQMLLNIAQQNISQQQSGMALALTERDHLKQRLMRIKSGNGFSQKKAIWVYAVIGILLIAISGLINVATADEEDRWIVINSEDSLQLMNVYTEDTRLVDEQGSFTQPIISPSGDAVAYQKNGQVRIKVWGNDREFILPVKDASEYYLWLDDQELLYAGKDGGVYGLKYASGEETKYLDQDHHYTNMLWDGKSKLYSLCWEFGKSTGIVQYDMKKNQEKLIIPAQQANWDIGDAGMRPTPAKLSVDGRFLYVWCQYQSGSTTTDGVPLGVYQVKEETFTVVDEQKVFVVPKAENIVIDPTDSSKVLINNGGRREWYLNKTLGIYDVDTNQYQPLLAKYWGDVVLPYGDDQLTMTTFTPAFSPDGKKVAFGAAKVPDDPYFAEEMGGQIYELDLVMGTLTAISPKGQLCQSPIYFDHGELWYVSDSKLVKQ